jgi:hypothetical protein
MVMDQFPMMAAVPNPVDNRLSLDTPRLIIVYTLMSDYEIQRIVTARRASPKEREAYAG